MIRLLILMTCFLVTTISSAEVMQCDTERKCSLVCYFPSSSARAEAVYPTSGVSIDRVRIEMVGDHNLLYTSERIDRSGTIPTYHSLEAFILPKDYPCRLAPVEVSQPLASPRTSDIAPVSHHGTSWLQGSSGAG